MRDFRTNREKNLDLVLCTPSAAGAGEGPGLAGLAEKYGVALDERESAELSDLPTPIQSSVGSVRVALEAKAAMTAHSKACPRLHDELDSSHQTIHGAIDSAIAVGLVMINSSATFVSPGMNKHDLSRWPVRVSRHKQPMAAKRVLEKVMEIRRRERIQDSGFDALGAMVVQCANDGSEVELVTEGYPEVGPGSLLSYEAMILRVSQLYATRFAE